MVPRAGSRCRRSDIVAALGLSSNNIVLRITSFIALMMLTMSPFLHEARALTVMDVTTSAVLTPGLVKSGLEVRVGGVNASSFALNITDMLLANGSLLINATGVNTTAVTDCTLAMSNSQLHPAVLAEPYIVSVSGDFGFRCSVTFTNVSVVVPSTARHASLAVFDFAFEDGPSSVSLEDTHVSGADIPVNYATVVNVSARALRGEDDSSSTHVSFNRANITLRATGAANGTDGGASLVNFADNVMHRLTVKTTNITLSTRLRPTPTYNLVSFGQYSAPVAVRASVTLRLDGVVFDGRGVGVVCAPLSFSSGAVLRLSVSSSHIRSDRQPIVMSTARSLPGTSDKTPELFVDFPSVSTVDHTCAQFLGTDTTIHPDVVLDRLLRQSCSLVSIASANRSDDFQTTLNLHYVTSLHALRRAKDAVMGGSLVTVVNVSHVVQLSILDPNITHETVAPSVVHASGVGYLGTLTIDRTAARVHMLARGRNVLLHFLEIGQLAAATVSANDWTVIDAASLLAFESVHMTRTTVQVVSNTVRAVVTPTGHAVVQVVLFRHCELREQAAVLQLNVASTATSAGEDFVPGLHSAPWAPLVATASNETLELLVHSRLKQLWVVESSGRDTSSELVSLEHIRTANVAFGQQISTASMGIVVSVNQPGTTHALTALAIAHWELWVNTFMAFDRTSLDVCCFGSECTSPQGGLHRLTSNHTMLSLRNSSATSNIGINGAGLHAISTAVFSIRGVAASSPLFVGPTSFHGLVKAEADVSLHRVTMSSLEVRLSSPLDRERHGDFAADITHFTARSVMALVVNAPVSMDNVNMTMHCTVLCVGLDIVGSTATNSHIIRALLINVRVNASATAGSVYAVRVVRPDVPAATVAAVNFDGGAVMLAGARGEVCAVGFTRPGVSKSELHTATDAWFPINVLLQRSMTVDLRQLPIANDSGSSVIAQGTPSTATVVDVKIVGVAGAVATMTTFISEGVRAVIVAGSGAAVCAVCVDHAAGSAISVQFDGNLLVTNPRAYSTIAANSSTGDVGDDDTVPLHAYAVSIANSTDASISVTSSTASVSLMADTAVAWAVGLDSLSTLQLDIQSSTVVLVAASSRGVSVSSLYPVMHSLTLGVTNVSFLTVARSSTSVATSAVLIDVDTDQACGETECHGTNRTRMNITALNISARVLHADQESGTHRWDEQVSVNSTVGAPSTVSFLAVAMNWSRVENSTNITLSMCQHDCAPLSKAFGAWELAAAAIRSVTRSFGIEGLMEDTIEPQAVPPSTHYIYSRATQTQLVLLQDPHTQADEASRPWHQVSSRQAASDVRLSIQLGVVRAELDRNASRGLGAQNFSAVYAVGICASGRVDFHSTEVVVWVVADNLPRIAGLTARSTATGLGTSPTLATAAPVFTVVGVRVRVLAVGTISSTSNSSIDRDVPKRGCVFLIDSEEVDAPDLTSLPGLDNVQSSSLHVASKDSKLPFPTDVDIQGIVHHHRTPAAPLVIRDVTIIGTIRGTATAIALSLWAGEDDSASQTVFIQQLVVRLRSIDSPLKGLQIVVQSKDQLLSRVVSISSSRIRLLEIGLSSSAAHVALEVDAFSGNRQGSQLVVSGNLLHVVGASSSVAAKVDYAVERGPATGASSSLLFTHNTISGVLRFAADDDGGSREAVLAQLRIARRSQEVVNVALSHNTIDVDAIAATRGAAGISLLQVALADGSPHFPSGAFAGRKRWTTIEGNRLSVSTQNMSSIAGIVLQATLVGQLASPLATPDGHHQNCLLRAAPSAFAHGPSNFTRICLEDPVTGWSPSFGGSAANSELCTNASAAVDLTVNVGESHASGDSDRPSMMQRLSHAHYVVDELDDAVSCIEPDTDFDRLSTSPLDNSSFLLLDSNTISVVETKYSGGSSIVFVRAFGTVLHGAHLMVRNTTADASLAVPLAASEVIANGSVAFLRGSLRFLNHAFGSTHLDKNKMLVMAKPSNTWASDEPWFIDVTGVSLSTAGALRGSIIAVWNNFTFDTGPEVNMTGDGEGVPAQHASIASFVGFDVEGSTAAVLIQKNDAVIRSPATENAVFARIRGPLSSTPPGSTPLASSLSEDDLSGDGLERITLIGHNTLRVSVGSLQRAAAAPSTSAVCSEIVLVAARSARPFVVHQNDLIVKVDRTLERLSRRASHLAAPGFSFPDDGSHVLAVYGVDTRMPVAATAAHPLALVATANTVRVEVVYLESPGQLVNDSVVTVRAAALVGSLTADRGVTVIMHNQIACTAQAPSANSSLESLAPWQTGCGIVPRGTVAHFGSDSMAEVSANRLYVVVSKNVVNDGSPFAEAPVFIQQLCVGDPDNVSQATVALLQNALSYSASGSVRRGGGSDGLEIQSGASGNSSIGATCSTALSAVPNLIGVHVTGRSGELSIVVARNDGSVLSDAVHVSVAGLFTDFAPPSFIGLCNEGSDFRNTSLAVVSNRAAAAALVSHGTYVATPAGDGSISTRRGAVQSSIVSNSMFGIGSGALLDMRTIPPGASPPNEIPLAFTTMLNTVRVQRANVSGSLVTVGRGMRLAPTLNHAATGTVRHPAVTAFNDRLFAFSAAADFALVRVAKGATLVGRDGVPSLQFDEVVQNVIRAPSKGYLVSVVGAGDDAGPAITGDSEPQPSAAVVINSSRVTLSNSPVNSSVVKWSDVVEVPFDVRINCLKVRVMPDAGRAPDEYSPIANLSIRRIPRWLNVGSGCGGWITPTMSHATPSSTINVITPSAASSASSSLTPLLTSTMQATASATITTPPSTSKCVTSSATLLATRTATGQEETAAPVPTDESDEVDLVMQIVLVAVPNTTSSLPDTVALRDVNTSTHAEVLMTCTVRGRGGRSREGATCFGPLRRSGTIGLELFITPDRPLDQPPEDWADGDAPDRLAAPPGTVLVDAPVSEWNMTHLRLDVSSIESLLRLNRTNNETLTGVVGSRRAARLLVAIAAAKFSLLPTGVPGDGWAAAHTRVDLIGWDGPPPAPPVSKPPVPEVVVEAAQASQTVAVAVSGLTGSPVTATQASRSNALLALARCTPEFEPLDFADHPTGLTFTSDRTKYHLGAVVMNAVLVIAWALLNACFAAVDACRRPHHSLHQSLAWARFPSASIFPVLFVIQPMTTSAAACIAFGPPAIVTAGAIAGLVILGFFALAIFFFRRVHRDSVTYVTPDDESHHQQAEQQRRRGTCGKVFSAVFSRDGEWTSIDSEMDCDRHFGALYDDFSVRAPWFAVLEMAFSVLLGIAMAVTQVAGCPGVAYVAVGLYVVYIVTLVYFRPHARRFDFGFTLLLGCAQLAIAALIVLKVNRASPSGSDEQSGEAAPTGDRTDEALALGIEIATMVTMFLMILRAGYDAIITVRDLFFKQLKRRLGVLKGHDRGQKDLGQALLLLDGDGADVAAPLALSSAAQPEVAVQPGTPEHFQLPAAAKTVAQRRNRSVSSHRAASASDDPFRDFTMFNDRGIATGYEEGARPLLDAVITSSSKARRASTEVTLALNASPDMPPMPAGELVPPLAQDSATHGIIRSLSRGGGSRGAAGSRASTTTPRRERVLSRARGASPASDPDEVLDFDESRGALDRMLKSPKLVPNASLVLLTNDSMPGPPQIVRGLGPDVTRPTALTLPSTAGPEKPRARRAAQPAPAPPTHQPQTTGDAVIDALLAGDEQAAPPPTQHRRRPQPTRKIAVPNAPPSDDALLDELLGGGGNDDAIGTSKNDDPLDLI